MPISLTWYGHATWLIADDSGNKILLDPFISANPSAPVKVDDVEVGTVLISHGHEDHVADAAAVTNKNDATLVASYEIANWFSSNHNVKNTIGMNIGGTAKLDFGSVKMTHAIHSSQLPDGSYGGNPGGFVVSIGGKNIYFACDTALFSDMQLIGKPGIDLAVLPIGDLFTMGVEDSIAAIEFIIPKQVLPSHYNTWPPIEQDADSWAKSVSERTSASPVVLQPGQSHEL